jgi:hypothetical protein
VITISTSHSLLFTCLLSLGCGTLLAESPIPPVAAASVTLASAEAQTKENAKIQAVAPAWGKSIPAPIRELILEQLKTQAGVLLLGENSYECIVRGTGRFELYEHKMRVYSVTPSPSDESRARGVLPSSYQVWIAAQSTRVYTGFLAAKDKSKLPRKDSLRVEFFQSKGDENFTLKPESWIASDWLQQFMFEVKKDGNQWSAKLTNDTAYIRPVSKGMVDKILKLK